MPRTKKHRFQVFLEVLVESTFEIACDQFIDESDRSEEDGYGSIR